MPTSRRLIALLPIASAAWLAGSALIAGAMRPGYDHVSQFLSELGASGTPGGAAMNYLGFIPTELFMLGFLALALRVMRPGPLGLAGLALLAVYAVSLIIAALAPCDAGCRPDTPSLSHTIHMATGSIAYLSALAGMAVLAIATGRRGAPRLMVAGLACAMAGAALLAGLDANSGVVGLVQRSLEGVIYAWLILFGLWLASRPPHASAPAPALSGETPTP